MEGQNIANILEYSKRHTKYIQTIYNAYKKAALKKPKISKTPFGGREAAPKGHFAKFGFFQAAILYVLYIVCIYLVCLLLYSGILAIF